MKKHKLTDRQRKVLGVLRGCKNVRLIQRCAGDTTSKSICYWRLIEAYGKVHKSTALSLIARKLVVLTGTTDYIISDKGEEALDES